MIMKSDVHTSLAWLMHDIYFLGNCNNHDVDSILTVPPSILKPAREVCSKHVAVCVVVVVTIDTIYEVHIARVYVQYSNYSISHQVVGVRAT